MGKRSYLQSKSTDITLQVFFPIKDFNVRILFFDLTHDTSHIIRTRRGQYAV